MPLKLFILSSSIEEAEFHTSTAKRSSNFKDGVLKPRTSNSDWLLKTIEKTITHFSWWKYWDVVLVYDPGLFLDLVWTPFFLQVLAGQPEQDVLLRVFTSEERPENFATLWKKKSWTLFKYETESLNRQQILNG